MKFVDEAKIFVRGGHGGAGAVSFRREKFIPKGGPDGGNGGKGGDVILCASSSHHTLLDLKYQQHHFAKNGGHGSGNNRTGPSAENLTVVVPPGTLVKDFATEAPAPMVPKSTRSSDAEVGVMVRVTGCCTLPIRPSEAEALVPVIAIEACL